MVYNVLQTTNMRTVIPDVPCFGWKSNCQRTYSHAISVYRPILIQFIHECFFQDRGRIFPFCLWFWSAISWHHNFFKHERLDDGTFFVDLTFPLWIIWQRLLYIFEMTLGTTTEDSCHCRRMQQLTTHETKNKLMIWILDLNNFEGGTQSREPKWLIKISFEPNEWFSKIGYGLRDTTRTLVQNQNMICWF